MPPSVRRASAAVILLLLLIGIGAFWIPALQRSFETFFATEHRLQDLRTLFVALGGALLGGAAIVSSLVLFSMQVNVERMPHGLFRRISADRRLLSAFAATFLLAVFIAALSLIQDARWVGAAIYGACWAIALILLLFLYGYRRALILINPIRQLSFVVARTRREFRAWVRRVKRAAPLLGGPPPPPLRSRNDPFAPKHDLARVTYFQANPGWTEGPKQAIRYAVSFARRYAEQGDHEVSATAMNAIVAINAAYVEAKGRTFFTYQFMFDNATADAKALAGPCPDRYTEILLLIDHIWIVVIDAIEKSGGPSLIDRVAPAGWLVERALQARWPRCVDAARPYIANARKNAS